MWTSVARRSRGFGSGGGGLHGERQEANSVGWSLPTARKGETARVEGWPATVLLEPLLGGWCSAQSLGAWSCHGLATVHARAAATGGKPREQADIVGAYAAALERGEARTEGREGIRLAR
jgi:hypothetical protein